MDPSQLVLLGKVAGIGGIALGVVVLLVRPLIGTVQGVPAADRARTINLIALGCFFIGALGIAAWVASSWSGGQSVSTAGAQSPGVISGGNTIIGTPSAAPANPSPAAPLAASPTAPPSNASVRTQGDQAPGVISGGNTSIQYATPPAPPPPASPAQSAPR